MRARPRSTAILGLVVWLAMMPDARSQSVEPACGASGTLAHTFDSGASWSACAHIDPLAGLVLSKLRYRAPGDRARSVLDSIKLGQLLLHWHDEDQPELRIGGLSDDTRGLGGVATVELSNRTCDGSLASAGTAEDTPSANVLCTRERPTGLLARYVGRPALQGETWDVFAVARQGLLTWRLGLAFGEDGRLDPSIELSGHGERASGATILATWRLALDLDTDADDVVEEFDFTLDETLGNRRPMSIRTLETESFRKVNRERFRGWRISDLQSGAGFYLDPLDSAQSWSDRSRDWARFDLALTREKACEQRADANRPRSAAVAPAPSTPAPATPTAATTVEADCGDTLDAFVNGEPLNGARTVLWFSRTRNWLPRPEDRPFVSSLPIGMELIPFDWTAASPFEHAR